MDERALLLVKIISRGSCFLIMVKRFGVPFNAVRVAFENGATVVRFVNGRFHFRDTENVLTVDKFFST